METRLVHSSGEWIANTTPIMVSKDADNAAQAHGSGMTYSRRYGVTALLCIVAEDDDDGNAAGTGEVTRSTAGGSNRQPGAVISDKQLGMLRAKLKDAGGNEPAACKLFGVESLGLLPKGRMNDALAEIQKKNPALMIAVASEAGGDKKTPELVAQKKKDHDEMVAKWGESLMVIRYHLGVVRDAAVEQFEADCELGERDQAKAFAEWNEFNNHEKTVLWLAPTKGGWFTTAEREALRKAPAQQSKD